MSLLLAHIAVHSSIAKIIVICAGVFIFAGVISAFLEDVTNGLLEIVIGLLVIIALLLGELVNKS